MYKLLFIFLMICTAQARPKRILDKINYKTYFGECPSRIAGQLTLKLVREFEKNQSLKDVKNLITKNKLQEKYFLSNYEIEYSPIRNFIKITYQCPQPLMRVQLYKGKGIDYYNAILVDNGELLDPTYEAMLRAEGKLKGELPSLAIPVNELEKETQTNLTRVIANMDKSLRKKVSEVILGEDKELTFILSVKGRASSVFLGKYDWEKKLRKVDKIISYMEKKRKIPSIINITNSKKVVVKFSDTI